VNGRRPCCIRTGTYRYVVWARVEDYALMGWLLGNAASDYSCLMWACECNQSGRAPAKKIHGEYTRGTHE
jgi:hypothetical protein